MLFYIRMYVIRFEITLDSMRRFDTEDENLEAP